MPDVAHLIAQSYSEEAAKAFRAFERAAEGLLPAVRVGKEIL